MTTQSPIIPLALQITLTVLYHISDDKPRASLTLLVPWELSLVIKLLSQHYELQIGEAGAELDITADTWDELCGRVCGIQALILDLVDNL